MFLSALDNLVTSIKTLKVERRSKSTTISLQMRVSSIDDTCRYFRIFYFQSTQDSSGQWSSLKIEIVSAQHVNFPGVACDWLTVVCKENFTISHLGSKINLTSHIYTCCADQCTNSYMFHIQKQISCKAVILMRSTYPVSGYRKCRNKRTLSCTGDHGALSTFGGEKNKTIMHTKYTPW